MNFIEVLPGILPSWSGQLGSLAWPLGLCSVLAISLVLERLVVFLANSRSFHAVRAAEKHLANGDHHTLKDIGQENSPCEIKRAIHALVAENGLASGQREALAQQWFDHYRKHLLDHLPWLSLIAVISPLLGLLGTVLGMIEAFSSLATVTGPVSPAMLAGGLQQAMSTTAAGLLIAVPTLVAAHGFRIWAQARADRVLALLNKIQIVMAAPAAKRLWGAADNSGPKASPRITPRWETSA